MDGAFDNTYTEAVLSVCPAPSPVNVHLKVAPPVIFLYMYTHMMAVPQHMTLQHHHFGGRGMSLKGFKLVLPNGHFLGGPATATTAATIIVLIPRIGGTAHSVLLLTTTANDDVVLARDDGVGCRCHII